jgi:serine-type D-Ala-D-Ala carboxypeptidase (penicillin-binding protein 5/6)
MRYLRTALFLLFAFSGLAAATERPPRVDAQAWILVDFHSANVLAEHAADRPIPPASLTKLMTAYLVFEKLEAGELSLNDSVTISAYAARARGSRLRFRPGATVPAESLIKGMLLRSANDASIALAEHIAGSEARFVDLMNARAKAWGLSNTHFVNPHGLDAPGHRSSARDLTRISIALIRDFPDYYRWFSLRQFSFNGQHVNNSNRLLHYDASVDGMKTGFTSQAGYCLVGSAQRGDMRLIATVLGARSTTARFNADKRLLDYGFRNFETRLVYGANKPATEARVWMGENALVPLGTSNNVYVTLPRGWHSRLRTYLNVPDLLYAPVSPGQQLGSLAVQLDDRIIGEYPLVALNEVPQGGLAQKAIDNLRLLLW